MWLEPYPDVLFEGAINVSLGPEARYEQTEASFWYDQKLVLATKSNPTRLYRFDALTGQGTHWPKYIGVLHGVAPHLRAAPVPRPQRPRGFRP